MSRPDYASSCENLTLGSHLDGSANDGNWDEAVVDDNGTEKQLQVFVDLPTPTSAIWAAS